MPREKPLLRWEFTTTLSLPRDAARAAQVALQKRHNDGALYPMGSPIPAHVMDASYHIDAGHVVRVVATVAPDGRVTYRIKEK